MCLLSPPLWAFLGVCEESLGRGSVGHHAVPMGAHVGTICSQEGFAHWVNFCFLV